MRHTLVYAARADDINVGANVILDVVLSQATTDLNQERLPISRPPPPLLLELSSSHLDTIRREVIQHDDIRASSNRLIGLVEALTLDLDLNGKAARRLGRAHSIGDAPRSNDVVVLEHRHSGEVNTVCVDAADEHAVLFDEAEPGRRLAGAGQDVGVAGFAQERQQVVRLCRDARAPGQRVEGYALAE